LILAEDAPGMFNAGLNRALTSGLTPKSAELKALSGTVSESVKHQLRSAVENGSNKKMIE
jgi:hypothetical protein